MSNSTLNIVSKFNGLADTLLTGGYHTLHQFKRHHIEHWGGLALLFIPVLDLLKTYLYYQKSNDEAYLRKKGGAYAGLTLSMYILKAMATTIGVFAVFTGMVAVGFGILVGVNAWMSLRSAAKAVSALYDGDRTRAVKHAKNFLINAGYTVAFGLIAFFPPLSTVAWGLALGSTIIATGAIIYGLVVGNKKEDELVIERTYAPAIPANANPAPSGTKKGQTPAYNNTRKQRNESSDSIRIGEKESNVSPRFLRMIEEAAFKAANDSDTSTSPSPSNSR